MSQQSTEPAYPTKTVAIIGLGLIGGSIAAALTETNAYDAIIGWDVRADVAEKIKNQGYITKASRSFEEAVADADIVILAMYIKGIIEALKNIGEIASPGTLIIDVGSTKAQIVSVMEQLPPTLRTIGGHPMAGKLTSSVEGVDSRLFQDRIFILTPTKHTTDNARQDALQLIQHLKAKPIILDAEEHDHLVAVISHLIRIIPIAIVETASKRRNDTVWELAAGGFREITRPVTSDLGFWLDVFSTNTAGISQALRALGQELITLAENFESGNIEAIKAADNRAREAWFNRYGGEKIGDDE